MYDGRRTDPALIKAIKIREKMEDVISSHNTHFYKGANFTDIDEFLTSTTFIIFIFYLYIGLRTTGFNIDNLNLDITNITHTNAFVILSASLLLSFSSVFIWKYWLKISEDTTPLIEERIDNTKLVTRECLDVLYEELSEESFDHVMIALHFLKDTF